MLILKIKKVEKEVKITRLKQKEETVKMCFPLFKATK
jgi:hypothetical protein